MCPVLESWAAEVARAELRDALPKRWLHVQGVARRARHAAAFMNSVDLDMLISAAYLHDIGYAPRLAATGFHPLDGARFLQSLEAPQRLCALVAHHSCAHKEAELRHLSAELSEWMAEEGDVRDALWWADMTTTPEGEDTNAQDRIEEIQKRYGSEHIVTFFIRQARTDLLAAVDRTEERLRGERIHIEK